MDLAQNLQVSHDALRNEQYEAGDSQWFTLLFAGRITHFGDDGEEVYTDNFGHDPIRGTDAANDTYFDPDDMIGINMYLKSETESIKKSTKAFWVEVRSDEERSDG